MVRRACIAAVAAGLLMASGGLAAAETSAPATRYPAPPPAPTASLSKNDVLILVRGILIALSQADQTGNYTVLRDLGSPEFQAANTASRLSDIFRPLRAQSFDLAGIAVLEPQLTLMPQIEKNGQLHMTGLFPSVPLQVRFDMVFVGQDQRWVLNGLSVALQSSAPGPGEAPQAKRASTPGGG